MVIHSFTRKVVSEFAAYGFKCFSFILFMASIYQICCFLDTPLFSYHILPVDKWLIRIEKCHIEHVNGALKVHCNSFVVSCCFLIGGFPYPLLSNRDVLEALLDGQRLEKPPNCSEDLWVHKVVAITYVTQSGMMSCLTAGKLIQSYVPPSPSWKERQKRWFKMLTKIILIWISS